MGFFQESELLTSQAPMPRTPQCGRCGLLRKCISPKMPIAGKGEKKILIVGEAPGEDEDKRNKPFVGRTGMLLQDTLEEFGINMRRDCWITNSLICRPPGNAEPSSVQIESCRPNIVNAIEELKPEKILLFGKAAVSSVIGWLWKKNVGEMGRWTGWHIPVQSINAWVCPAWHPSFIARIDDRDSSGRVIRVLWRNDIRNALKVQGRPWSVVPDYESQVRIIINHHEAGEAIREIIKAGRTCAFDYETNCLKPDWDDAEIVSCSISNGHNTISYPWLGDAIVATREFVQSKVKKIASNIKFEDRWTRRKLKSKVRNWWWDTMVGGHVQDNRRGITSIKFQSFIWLGARAYNDHIEPFLRTKGNAKINTVIKSVELKQLLLYGGLDSLLEYHTCFKQRKVLGYVHR